MKEQQILDAVQEQYASVARSGLTNGSDAVRSVAQAFGYSEEDLASLPPQANMGLSCGNPVALAGLREGEVVVDLGCGGGLDVLLASKRVGATGKVIGIDMTPEMIERARAGATQLATTNVEFHLAQIDQLPLPDNSVDCIISNCVINLVPDKSKAFGEILRVLKPGGRMVVSDIALRKTLPAEVVVDIQAYVGCIAGALEITEYERLLREAGFDAVLVQDTGADLNTYAQAASGGCCSSGACATGENSSPVHDGLAEVLHAFDANAYAASVRVHALKAAAIQDHNSTENIEGKAMTSVQVFDKPMCCSTGVCGPEVDPVLPRFAADLDWLKTQGCRVERLNLAQEPMRFAENPSVQKLLQERGTSCLPMILINGIVVSAGDYPSRETLASLLEKKPSRVLPVSQAPGGCCSGSGCC